jgi:hypothetical protein
LGRDEQGELVHRRRWQAQLLPLMSAAIVLAGLFFAAMSIFELRDFYKRVEHQPFTLNESFAAFEAARPTAIDNDPSYLRFKVAALLEANAMERRYRQANSTMLARVWTRQLGFLTGMLLALIGAAFILGRLQEGETRIEAEAQGAKGVLTSSSPGLVLAVLGTVLMGITIWIPFGVETRDLNTYLRPAATAEALPPPPSPPEIDPKAKEKQLFGPSTGEPPP